MASSKGERCVRAGDTSDPKADIRFSFLWKRERKTFPSGRGEPRQEQCKSKPSERTGRKARGLRRKR